jgi:hypothetical protein
VTVLAWRYAVAAVVIGILAAVTPRDAHGEIASSGGNAISVVCGLLAIATIAFACVQQAPLRREVYSGAAPRDSVPVDPALTAALEARQRRADARQLAARDPLLARDLLIGRPDMPHTFDDGGVVDLNSAPPRVIAEVCDLPDITASGIVAARPLGGFMTVDDVFTLADIPIAAWDIIRDRAVAIPRLA